MIKQQQQPFYFLPFIVFVAAIGFLIILLSTIKEDVFFSGDAGLKFLMIKQMAKGGSAVSLNLESPSWVSTIWSQGFYPFRIPFVYDAAQGKIVSFPPAFQWINSWLFRCFGFKGIFILPAASLAGLWLWFIVMMRKTGVNPLVVSVTFFLLAFSSPLTVYGALYWEHSLAMLLLFCGFVFLLLHRMSVIYAAVLGLMCGMSVWCRPEMLLLCSLLLIIAGVNQIRQKNRTNIIFIAATLLTITAFLIFNNIVYNNMLGAHSYQLSEPDDPKNFIIRKLILLTHLNARLVIYFPFVMVFFAFSSYSFLKRYRRTVLENRLTVIIIVFLLVVPFALPNAGGKQWGPRYFLPVVPLVLIVLCQAFKQQNIKQVNKLVWIILLPVVLYSVYLNVFLAHRTLNDDYAYRVKPGLDFLKSRSCQELVVQNQYIAQEFAAMFGTKNVFLAENKNSFDKLKALLKTNKIDQVIYLSRDSNFQMLADNLLTNGPGLKKIGDYYFAEYILK